MPLVPCLSFKEYGYIQDTPVDETIRIEIDEFIDTSKLTQYGCENFIRCESKVVPGQKNMDEKYYFWTTKNDIIEIKEYNLVAKNRHVTLTIGGSCHFYRCSIQFSSTYMFIIIHYDVFLVILSFRIDRISPSDSVLSLLTQKSFIRQIIRSYCIRGIFTCGYFKSKGSVFAFYSLEYNRLHNYKLGLPPDEPPEYQSHITLKSCKTNIFDGIFNAVQSYKSNKYEVMGLKSNTYNESVYIFCIFKDGSCFLIRNSDYVYYHISGSKNPPETDINVNTECQISIMGKDNIYIGLIVKTNINNSLYLLSCDSNSPSLSLTLIKAIPLMFDSVVASSFYKNTFLVVAEGLKMYKTNMDSTQYWESLPFDNRMDLYNNNISKIFSHSLNDKAIKKWTKIDSYLNKSNIGDKFYLIEYLFNNLGFDTDSEYWNNMIDHLEKYQTYLNYSVESASLLAKDDIMFLYLPNCGTKIICNDIWGSLETRYELLSVFYYFNLSTAFEKIPLGGILDLLIEKIDSNISEKIMNLGDIYGLVAELFPITFRLFTTSLNSCIITFITALFPPFHPFLQESSIYEITKKDALPQNFYTATFSTLLLENIEYIQKLSISIKFLFAFYSRSFHYSGLNSTEIKFLNEKCSVLLNSLILFSNFLKNLSIVKFKPDSNISTLEILISKTMVKHENEHGFSFTSDYIYSKLLYDQRPYFELIYHLPFDVLKPIFQNLYYIYKKLSSVEEFKYFKWLKNNLLFVRIIFSMYNKEMSQLPGMLFKLIDDIKTDCSNYFLFENSSLAILSIVESAFDFLPKLEFDYVSTSITEIIKCHRRYPELILKIAQRRFEFMLKIEDFEESLNILQGLDSINGNTTFYVDVFVSKLLERQEIHRLINLNYLNVEKPVFDYLYNKCFSSQDISVTITFYDVIIKFCTIRRYYSKVSQMAFDIFLKLCEEYLNNGAVHFLDELYRFISISYNSLSLVKEADWKFIQTPSVIPNCFFLKCFPTLDISDVKAILLTVFSLIQLRKIQHDVLSIRSYDNLLSLLAKEYFYDTAIDLCSMLSLEENLFNIVKQIIDLCYGLETDLSDKVISTLNERNKILIAPKSSLGIIWEWFQRTCEFCQRPESEILIKAASYMLSKNHIIPCWLIEILRLRSPNQLIKVYLINDHLIDASELLSYLLYHQSNERTNIAVSTYVIDEVTIRLKDKIDELSSKLQITTDEMYNIQLLISSQTRLLYNLKTFQDYCQLKTNNLKVSV